MLYVRHKHHHILMMQVLYQGYHPKRLLGALRCFMVDTNITIYLLCRLLLYQGYHPKRFLGALRCFMVDTWNCFLNIMHH